MRSKLHPVRVKKRLALIYTPYTVLVQLEMGSVRGDYLGVVSIY